MDLQAELNKRYPLDVELQDKSRVSLRPLIASDEEKLAAFFKRIPLSERELFRDDVTKKSVIKRWCKNIDYNRILPILALVGDRIVADATLHRSSVRASNHVAVVRLSVDPEYQGRGLAHRMIKSLMAIAPDMGVAMVDAEVLPEQNRAMGVFEDLEFIRVGTLPQHVRDLNDQFHDVILLTYVTMQPESLSPDALLTEDEVDIGGQG